MSIGKDLPIQNEILSYLQDAVLFIQANGVIVTGNKKAYSVLTIEGSQSSIYDYLDFALLKNMNKKRLLMVHRKNHGQMLYVRSIQIKHDLYCLLINEATLEEKATKVKEQMSKLMNTVTEGIVLYNEQKIIDCDSMFAALFAYTNDEIKQLKINQLFDESSDEALYQMKDASNNVTYELTGIKKDGTQFFVEFMQYSYTDLDHTIYVAIARDISERIANKKRIEFMAYYDELTNLPNRNYFTKVLSEAIEEAKKTDEQIAVFYMDIDYFKEINDTLGYSFGDKLLLACANRLQRVLEPDMFLARMSGDEFMLLKRNIDNIGATLLAEKLIAEFQTPLNIDGYEIYTSLSIGISLFPESGMTSKDLIKHADSALYVIKGKMPNSYNIFENSISENFRKMLTMENELRKALYENQFQLHYQPQKCLRTRKVVGLEALLRWNHPTRGNIPPGEFIPLAEKTGLIIEIGNWVLNEACRQNKAWQNEGFAPIVVSVNLSPKQFNQRKLVEQVKNVLDETGLEAKYLELEITESMAMTNETYILKTMNDLRSLGVNVSIDDFGTGYSSFRYLSLFPINKLKIDRMFMDEKQKRNRAIVKSIIHMSHSLNMRVIAEGVETEEQLSFLEQENCDEMQGFYFSKPLPPDMLRKFLRVC